MSQRVTVSMKYTESESKEKTGAWHVMGGVFFVSKGYSNVTRGCFKVGYVFLIKGFESQRE